MDNACTVGCDRTCGKCATDVCYDMIPAPHELFYANQLSVNSEWPNGDGENALPTKGSNSQQLYPFDPSFVSSFCKSVFDQHKCDSEDLRLVYNAGTASEKSFVLSGPAFEYCRFSCGRCSQTGSCYATHNNAMQLLARDPDATVGFFANDAFGDWEEDFWGNDGNNETEDWSAPPSADEFFDVDEEEKDDEESNIEETSNFSFSAISFDSADWDWDFRRRRSNDFNPKLAGVVNLVRKRRYLNQVYNELFLSLAV